MANEIGTVLRTIDPDDYDPRIPLADPYPVYRALRERDPVMWNEPSRTWIVTGYEPLLQVMRDDENFYQAYETRETTRYGEQVSEQPYFQLFRRMLFLRDGADHKRLRPLFSSWFLGPTRMRELAPMVDRVVKDVFDELDGKDSFDIVKDLAYPIPLRVISELLGVPASDSTMIANDIHDVIPVVESIQKKPEVVARADAAIVRLHDYLLDLVKERRKNMGTDLLSAMISAYDEGGTFDDELELIANILLAYIGGHETTTDSFTLAVLSLFRNPDQLDLLRQKPEIMKPAVTELLRYDTTGQGFSRRAMKDVVVSGKEIPEGSYMLLLLGAANHDPAIFQDPDRLLLERNASRSVSFGGGAHVCVGNMLARHELVSGLSELLKRKPGMRLETVDPPLTDYKKTLTRGLLGLRAHS